jgi:hypothetical protein
MRWWRCFSSFCWTGFASANSLVLNGLLEWVNAKQGILSAESNEAAYGVEVCFWNGVEYRHEPIDY